MNDPVAYIKDKEISYMLAVKQAGAKEWRTNLGLYYERGDVALYTTPSKREWVDLTEQEVKDIFEMDLGAYESIEETMRQLKDKNT
jgi:hypothetical protein